MAVSPPPVESWKVCEICYINHTTHLTLGTLLHYLGISKIHVFCKYSADMVRMQASCILGAPISIPVRVLLCMLSVFMCFNQTLCPRR